MIPLTQANKQRTDSKCVDWNEVCLDNGEIMIDQADGEGVFNRGVDDTEKMSLAGLEFHTVIGTTTLGVHMRAVEEDIVAVRSGSRRGNQRMLNVISGAIIPISNREDTQIFVVWQRLRTIDLDCSDDSISVLRREMRMVPALSVSRLLIF
jgi:hypothetical protein